MCVCIYIYIYIYIYICIEREIEREREIIADETVDFVSFGVAFMRNLEIYPRLRLQGPPRWKRTQKCTGKQRIAWRQESGVTYRDIQDPLIGHRGQTTESTNKKEGEDKLLAAGNIGIVIFSAT